LVTPGVGVLVGCWIGVVPDATNGFAELPSPSQTGIMTLYTMVCALPLVAEVRRSARRATEKKLHSGVFPMDASYCLQDM
jgi:hypothetical protein